MSAPLLEPDPCLIFGRPAPTMPFEKTTGEWVTILPPLFVVGLTVATSFMDFFAASYCTGAHTKAHRATLNLAEKRRSINSSCRQVDFIISTLSQVFYLEQATINALA